MCGQNAPRRAPLFPLVRFPTSAGALKARFCAALPQRLVSRLDLSGKFLKIQTSENFLNLANGG